MLEITESAVMENGTGDDRDARTRCKALGVRLALDDFGTGYSSLTYLHRFPLDVLKIDRSFIGGARARTTRARRSRGAIVSLAQALGLAAVAEGIEDRAQQRDASSALGCTHGQGFLFSRPQPPPAFDDVLRGGRALSPADAPPAR